MTQLEPSASPFDAIHQTRPDNSEFWSARDLMPMLGYDQWRRFEDSVERAMASARSQGISTADHFADAGKKVQIGSDANRVVTDYHLTRFAAYLVAMNGDPRKPEVAAAQSYFAVKTREAETAPPALALPKSYAEALRELAATVEAKEAAVERAQIAETQVRELESPARAWDALSNAQGDFTVSDAAKILARDGITTGPRKLYDWLAAHGWVFRRGGRWQGMQSVINAGFLVERVTSGYFDQETGERKQADPQVRVTPKGLERLRSELSAGAFLTVVGS